MTDSTVPKIFPINEAYACLQGEGKYQGVPHLLIRFTGCPLRCQFGEDNFCDTPYSSWTPEKGKFDWTSLYELYQAHPEISHTMITGGAPTSHPATLQVVVGLAKDFNHFVTIETEGSNFVHTKADFISLSPKLQSSIPQIGAILSFNKESSLNLVTLQHVETHNRYRTNYEAMKQLIRSHPDYQVKFVINTEADITEVLAILYILDVPKTKAWLMPSGVTAEQLSQKRVDIIELALRHGFNYTDRLHIIAYGNLRGV